MKLTVCVSNRHIHLNESDYKVLFNDTVFEKKNDLKQPGEFASTLTVTIKSDKDTISNVRVLGPIRGYSQIEICKTDAYKLGINPDIRKSGDILNCPSLEVIGPCGSVDVNVIIPERHIHISKTMLDNYGLDANKSYNVLVGGIKGGILSNVKLKVSDNAFFEIHLDTDDANAFLLKNNDIVELIEE